jgi:hypothetical protein
MLWRASAFDDDASRPWGCNLLVAFREAVNYDFL